MANAADRPASRPPGPQWSPALLTTPLADTSIRCDLCPFQCVIAPGHTGPCKVRRNDNGAAQTLTRSVAAKHLDAIERKPFYHVRPGTKVLTVASPGCTFRCDYCVNHRLSQYARDADLPWTAVAASPADLVTAAAQEHAAIGMSYSEPGLAPELTLALAELARPRGIPLVWKTNGFLTAKAIDLLAPALTAANIDVKAAEDAAHRRLTGAPLGPVLDAIERFRAAGVWLEITTPLVPGTASEPGQLRAIASRLASISPDLPWHLVRFTPDYRLADSLPSSPDALAAAVAIGREAGLRYVYVERALGPAGRRTTCPECAVTLIDRDIWSLGENTLASGSCPACGRPIPGVWE